MATKTTKIKVSFSQLLHLGSVQSSQDVKDNLTFDGFVWQCGQFLQSSSVIHAWYKFSLYQRRQAFNLGNYIVKTLNREARNDPKLIIPTIYQPDSQSAVAVSYMRSYYQ